MWAWLHCALHLPPQELESVLDHGPEESFRPRLVLLIYFLIQLDLKCFFPGRWISSEAHWGNLKDEASGQQSKISMPPKHTGRSRLP